jgi:hypothetical protein
VTEQTQPEQPTSAPTQSPEDVMKRMAGIPKTPEELEAEREAMEEERKAKMVQPSVPAPGPEPGPTPPPEPEPEQPTSP